MYGAYTQLFRDIDPKHGLRITRSGTTLGIKGMHASKASVRLLRTSLTLPVRADKRFVYSMTFESNAHFQSSFFGLASRSFTVLPHQTSPG